MAYKNFPLVESTSVTRLYKGLLRSVTGIIETEKEFSESRSES